MCECVDVVGWKEIDFVYVVVEVYIFYYQLGESGKENSVNKIQRKDRVLESRKIPRKNRILESRKN